jgi:hypothetical protein
VVATACRSYFSFACQPERGVSLILNDINIDNNMPQEVQLIVLVSWHLCMSCNEEVSWFLSRPALANDLSMDVEVL